MRRLPIAIIGLVLGCSTMLAEPTLLTLEACRDMAARDNTQIRIDQENAKSAMYLRKSVMARFFPQISANGAYAFNSRHIHVVPDEMELSFGTWGLNGMTFNNPTIQAYQILLPQGTEALNSLTGSIYRELYNQLDFNVTHVLVGQVGIIQPIWVGGRITQAYKITKAVENLAKIRAAKNMAELTVNVDEAYWRVISVSQKKKVAMKYHQLLTKLMEDIEEAKEEGVATQADVLNVRVKLSEAETMLAQATDGLELSEMALCQIIGLPLYTEIKLDDSHLNDVVLADSTLNIQEVLSRRDELKMLEEMQKLAKAGVGMAAAGLQPNIVASANYIVSNPNVANGFQNNFAGFFSAGVVVNVPIAHASDILAVKAAKHKQKTVELQMQEAREKIELQATQSAQKVIEANKALIRATNSIRHAEENLQYAQDSYAEGVITSSQLMMAQTAWQKAESEKIDAAIALRMAEITHKKNIGQL